MCCIAGGGGSHTNSAPAHPVPSSMRRSSSISLACRLSTAASDSTCKARERTQSEGAHTSSSAGSTLGHGSACGAQPAHPTGSTAAKLPHAPRSRWRCSPRAWRGRQTAACCRQGLGRGDSMNAAADHDTEHLAWQSHQGRLARTCVVPAQLPTPPAHLIVPAQLPAPPTPPVGLLHVHHRGGARADDGGLCVAAQAGLQDARQLGVAVRDVAAWQQRGKQGEASR